MKMAVVTFTPGGVEIAQKISKGFEGHLSIYARRGNSTDENMYIYDSIGKLLEEVYPLYDGLIFVMSTGVVIRAIANYIKDKRFTPSIVVLDENGQHVISLLSGYFGGANELAKKVATTIDAMPVITTPIEINRPTVDFLATRLCLAIEPIEKLRQINSAIINGESVGFFIDKGVPGAHSHIEKAKSIGITLYDTEEMQESECNYEACVVITDKIVRAKCDKLRVYLRPATLSVSIVTQKGISDVDVYEAIIKACEKVNRSFHSVKILTAYRTAVVETGIIMAARKLGIPIEYLDGHVLKGKDLFNENANFEKLCEKSLLKKSGMKMLLPVFNYQDAIKISIAETVNSN